ncbi:hypothetical protein ACFQ49_05190 [Kroppenstedtia eburnea]|uniref:Uncharacterized protein n=1 Tax=Kroppenstedtia eburnea TaxID=714067 RepID=A0A1N7IXN5_9BACL|nr:hypothetical protein [Kroppenstedtia eburnea]EGK13532.1 hypothetical protein HMPREF9374_0780 [Desmospora sp. 8437]QKI82302.1 hypothetical protein GXN75_09965 [Kroppenstedtia eburnea]SIS41868.1 hypothetical protein SAMN05421790_101478 [Kroppenstedtia eburnea]
MAKKKRHRGNRPTGELRTPRKKKKIKEADLFYSREVAPLRRELRRAQQARHLEAVDDLWKRLQESLKQHRLLVKRARFVARP